MSNLDLILMVVALGGGVLLAWLFMARRRLRILANERDQEELASAMNAVADDLTKPPPRNPSRPKGAPRNPTR